jgi:hypothetical protein
MKVASTFVLLIVTLGLVAACDGCGAPPSTGAGEGEGEGQGEGEGEGEPVGEGEGEPEPPPLDPPDPEDPDNANVDNDCDGLSDADEFSRIWPGGGRLDPGTRDSDNDGVRDGVEAGKTSTVDARCADRFVADADPSTTTNPTDPDSDDDGAIDGAEDQNGNGRLDPGETNPNNPDSDGDGVCDGPDDVAGACTGNDDPTVNADADGDGLPDRLDASPNNPDSDGDGLCDGGNSVTGVCVSGEDLDNDGLLDVGESDPSRTDVDCDGLSDAQEREAGTDPSRRDTDADGADDGVEAGSMGSADPACPAGSGQDLDPSTTSNPLDNDSDDDGLLDGQEDTNGNGRIDPGELNPQDSVDGADPVVQQACSAANLVPLSGIVSTTADVQVVVRNDRFVQRGVVRSGSEVGVFGIDDASQVGFVAVTQASSGANVGDDELAVRAAVASVGGANAPIVQQFTTWDDHPGALGRYDQTGSATLGARLAALLQALVPGSDIPFPVDGAAVDGFRVEVDVVRRSATERVVVLGVLPLSRASGDDLLSLRDVVDGSALGRARDGLGVRCERTAAVPFSSVDILWAVDNSTSMGDEQAAVAAAAEAFATKLSNSTIDWRAGVVTSSFYSPRTTVDAACTNAVCNPLTSSQCRTFTRDLPELTASFTEANAAWVGAGGACNQSREAILRGAQLMMTESTGLATFAPAAADEQPGRLRANADILVILLGDADDLFPDENAAAAGIDAYETFFRGLSQRVTFGGILCAEGELCGEDQREPRVARNLVNRFGGVVGTLNDVAAIPAAIDAIIDSAIADSSPYVLAQDAISTSVKVSVAPGATLGACNVNDMPRSRQSGFDYDARTRTINFFGDCRPVVQGATIAVSYRTWVQSPPQQQEDSCACQCGGNFLCVDTGAEFCGCQCEQSLTCSAGFVFDAAACACVCDANQACPATYVLDVESCSCACRDECGGCAEGTICQPSLCECRGIGG